jgi:pimeloyl-ACP methyl ester carboxylesterase
MPRGKNPVVIVHGWSDTSDSFQPLAQFLSAQGFQTVSLLLADYVSMDDDVSIDDAAKAMEAALRGQIASGQLSLPFDLVVHSTGGLVARAWLSGYYSGLEPQQLPVQRLVMLAPANFGSPLATVGQTILGRVVRGWDHGLHTGKQMLQGLELGSPFQWDLALRDLFQLGPDTGSSVYGPEAVWPFVLVGSMPYQSGLRQMVNEHGSDGTVRVAAANLNAYGATLDFSIPGGAALMGMAPGNSAAAQARGQFTPWAHRHGETMVFPLAVMNRRDHGSIIDPAGHGDGESEGERQLLQQFLLAALACDSYAGYQALEQAWTAHSDAVQDPATADDDHQMHLQINVFVVDEFQKPVTDYMVEFLAPNYRQNTDLSGVFHDKVISDVHKNDQNAAVRTIFINRQRLFELFYARIPAGQPQELRLSISAAAPGRNVSYFDTAQGAEGEFVVHGVDEATRWLHRNATHFLKIVIPRVGVDGVFRLKRHS